MDDDQNPAEAQHFRDGLDRELTAVGATESARQRLRARLATEPSSWAVVTKPAARWLVPLTTAAAVVAIVAVPPLLKDDSPKPVLPGVSVPDVEPTTEPTQALVSPSPTTSPKPSYPQPVLPTTDTHGPSGTQTPSPVLPDAEPSATFSPSFTMTVPPAISESPTAPPASTGRASTTSEPTSASRG